MECVMKNFFLIAGTVLILSALGLTSYNIYDDFHAKEQSAGLLEQLEEKSVIDIVPVVVPLAEEDNTAIEETPADEVATVTIDDYDLMGEIEIPALSIKLPLISEWSYPRLKVAPCRYSGSIENNNLILAAHNYNNHFGRLKDLGIGEHIVLTDVYGSRHVYSVASLEVIRDNQLYDLVKEGTWDLTLFTCTKGGQMRVVVRLNKDTTI